MSIPETPVSVRQWGLVEIWPREIFSQRMMHDVITGVKWKLVVSKTRKMLIQFCFGFIFSINLLREFAANFALCRGVTGLCWPKRITVPVLRRAVSDGTLGSFGKVHPTAPALPASWLQERATESLPVQVS